MKHLISLFLLLLASCQPAVAQSVLPQMKIDKTGSTKTLSVRDPATGVDAPMGSITGNVFNLRGLTGASESVQGTGTPGLDNLTKGWFLYSHPTSLSVNNPTDVLRIDRNADYAGGAGGPFAYVRSGLHVSTYVNAANSGNEWAGTFVLNNYGTGENNAGFFQANKFSGASHTWVTTIEARDYSGTVNPTTALIASEMDLFGSGGDSNRQRIGVNFVCGKHEVASIKAQCGRGLWFTPVNGDTTSGYWGRIIEVNGEFDSVIDTTGGTETRAAIMLAPTQKIALDGATNGNYSRYFYYAGGSLYYQTINSNVMAIDDTGKLFASGGVQLPALTVATLPTCDAGRAGLLFYVTDATAPTWNAALTGGGAVKAMAMCNGTAWTAH